VGKVCGKVLLGYGWHLFFSSNVVMWYAIDKRISTGYGFTCRSDYQSPDTEQNESA